MKFLGLTQCLALAVALTFTSLAQAQGVELGSNLGFEDPMGALNNPAVPGNWFGFTGPGATGVGTNTIDPRTGATHAEVVIAGVGDSFAGIQQAVAATEGETYTFSFFARTDGNLFDVGHEYRIEWLDAGGTELSRVQLTDPVVDGAYAPFSVSGVAPVGTTNLRAVIALQSFQGGTTGTARIDDTSIIGPAAVPEPGSLVLIALGALGMASRRRR